SPPLPPPSAGRSPTRSGSAPPPGPPPPARPPATSRPHTSPPPRSAGRPRRAAAAVSEPPPYVLLLDDRPGRLPKTVRPEPGQVQRRTRDGGISEPRSPRRPYPLRVSPGLVAPADPVKVLRRRPAEGTGLTFAEAPGSGRVAAQQQHGGVVRQRPAHMLDQVGPQRVQGLLRIAGVQQPGAVGQRVEGAAGVTRLDHPVGEQQDLVALAERHPVWLGPVGRQRPQPQRQALLRRLYREDLPPVAEQQRRRVTEVEQRDLVLVHLGQDRRHERLPAQVAAEAGL